MTKKVLQVALWAICLAAPAALWAGEAANSISVCGCGMVFTPDANTKYVEVDGQKFACCSEACHETAAKDPAASARASRAATDRVVVLSRMKIGVTNVYSVTEVGTHAMCGCGKKFNIDATTEYFNVDGQHYACCSHACHEMASKDPASAAASARSHLKKG